MCFYYIVVPLIFLSLMHEYHEQVARTVLRDANQSCATRYKQSEVTHVLHIAPI
jgi:hypothetical protein